MHYLLCIDLLKSHLSDRWKATGALDVASLITARQHVSVAASPTAMWHMSQRRWCIQASYQPSKQSLFDLFKYQSICLDTHTHAGPQTTLREVFTEWPGCWRQSMGLMQWKSNEGSCDDVFYYAIIPSPSSLKSPFTVGKSCIRRHLCALKQSQRQSLQEKTYMGMCLVRMQRTVILKLYIISCLLHFVAVHRSIQMIKVISF